MRQLTIMQQQTGSSEMSVIWGLAVLVFLSKVITVYKSQMTKLVKRDNDIQRHINREGERERAREGERERERGERGTIANMEECT